MLTQRFIAENLHYSTDLSLIPVSVVFSEEIERLL